MARPIHFEIHASNPQALLGFYTQLFGWQAQQWGSEPYWLLTTGPDGEPGINGALLQRRGPAPTDGAAVNACVCTVAVNNLDQSAQQALALGATMAVDKMPIPGMGWLAYIKDLDGNIMGLLQYDANAN